MPEMDGLTLLKKLKESEIDTAMLMMTAHGDIHDAVEAIKLGAYDYLLKPNWRNLASPSRSWSATGLAMGA
jgi:DNA-binding NtrC family response regulator